LLNKCQFAHYETTVIWFNKTVTTLGQQFWRVIDAPWPTVGWSNRSFSSLASTTLKNFPVISILLSEVSRVHNHTGHRPDVSLYFLRFSSGVLAKRSHFLLNSVLVMAILGVNVCILRLLLSSAQVVYSLNSTGIGNIFDPDTSCNWIRSWLHWTGASLWLGTFNAATDI